MRFTEEYRDKLRKIALMKLNIKERTDKETRNLWFLLYPNERVNEILENNNDEEFNQMCRIYNGIAKLYLDKSSSR